MMSKTLGNVLDPLEITEKHGTDAFRMALLISAGAGSDIVYSEDRVIAARAFANKIWNAARLVLSAAPTNQPATTQPSLEDRWIKSRIARTTEEVNRALEQHRYHEAAHMLWHAFWGDFCDWYLEINKLNPDRSQLVGIFETYLRLLHPVMPFITEELWHRLGHETSIALQPYPKVEGIDEEAERDMALLQEMITAARAIRADHNIDKKLVLEGQLYTRNGARAVAQNHLEVLQKLANVKLAVSSETPRKLEGAIRSTPDFDLRLETPEADLNAQRNRLRKEVDQYTKLVADKDRQLANEKFLASAPTHVVEGLRQKREEYQAQLEKSQAALNNLQ